MQKFSDSDQRADGGVLTQSETLSTSIYAGDLPLFGRLARQSRARLRQTAKAKAKNLGALLPPKSRAVFAGRRTPFPFQRVLVRLSLC